MVSASVSGVLGTGPHSEGQGTEVVRKSVNEAVMEDKFVVG
jgi:hypothetical protein